MAHSKSALKRWRQSLKHRDRNRSDKSRTRTLLNSALSAISTNPGEAEAAVKAAVSGLDKAAQKGIIHDNAAARSKSRLLKRYNLAVASAVARAAAGPAEEKPAPARRARATAAPANKKPVTAKKPAAAKKPATRSTAPAKSAEKPAPRSRKKE